MAGSLRGRFPSPEPKNRLFNLHRRWVAPVTPATHENRCRGCGEREGEVERAAMAEGQEKADEEGQGGEGDEEEALWAQQVAVLRPGAGGGAPLPLHWSGLRAAGRVG